MLDVTSKKHLNPLGSVVHVTIVGFVTLIFGVTAAALSAFGDVSSPQVQGAIVWSILGMMVSSVFTLNELSHIRKSKSQK